MKKSRLPSSSATDVFSRHPSGGAKVADDLVQLFNACFAETENTILLGNAEEPVYQPANKEPANKEPANKEPANKERQYHQVIFTRDYFSSALHEIAHWCIAGEKRRTLVDYGYWYLPDGRDAEQQAKFEAAEIKPQALEYTFSIACDIKFRVSVDNLQGPVSCSKDFESAVEQQLMQFIEFGFSARAQQFLDALHHRYNTAFVCASSYKIKND